MEIGADVLLKGTRVDGVYTSDPEKDPACCEIRYSISFEEVISKRLKVMDSTAFTMCRDNNMPVIVFDMNKSGNLKKLVDGEKIGTLVIKLIGYCYSIYFTIFVLSVSKTALTRYCEPY